MKKHFYLLTLLALLCACQQEPTTNQNPLTPADYVSTLVGTQSDIRLSAGNLYPATALPGGMNFWTPMTGKMGNGWAYTYTINQMRGFKQTHQPSPWINDYCQFALMPVRDSVGLDEDSRASLFSHLSETAKPYYYQVYLADHDVNVEIAPTERAAIFRFTFPESNTSGIIFDAFDPDCIIEIDSVAHTLKGNLRNVSNRRALVPDNFRNYFTLTFDRPFESWAIEGDKAIVHFVTHRGDQICVKVASSFISAEQAETNLLEIGDKDFDQVCSEAKDKWNEVLGRIEVEGGTDEQMRTFYSCLYRATLFPRKFYEIDKEGKVWHYSPYNGEVREGYLYTDSGFWDTFRALFPLLNLAYSSINSEIQEGLWHIAEENEFLPEWASPGHTRCMIGNNSASIVADAYIKGVNEKGIEKLYEAITYGTENVHPQLNSVGRYGHEYYNTLGYIPYNVGINENVARTLEYAYDDWCILQVAKKLGRPQEELDKWEARSKNYRNVFDSTTLLMRGRNQDGSFQEPFNPYKWGDAYTEGNAWHYTWSVFHDIPGLIDLMGGEDNFVAMLDSVFVVPPIYDDSYYGGRIHEIAEMQVADMGNYAHGNQPAQHMVYLYDYANQPWKTQQHVREAMDKLYRPTPDGYCGDEDNGQTSAWYIFSALGFYPVCPASNEYALGAPLFKKATIHLENGNDLVIEAPANSKENLYVKRITFNGKEYKDNFLNYEDLLQGGKISFDMNSEPNKER